MDSSEIFQNYHKYHVKTLSVSWNWLLVLKKTNARKMPILKKGIMCNSADKTHLFEHIWPQWVTVATVSAKTLHKFM